MQRISSFVSQSKFANQTIKLPSTRPNFLERGEGWVESLRNTGKDRELGKVVAEVLKTVGASNSLLCALFFMGVALDRFLTVKPNEKKCTRLLEMMGTTLLNLKYMKKEFSKDNIVVIHKALQIVLENCVICYDYLAGRTISKIWNAKSMEEQIREAQHLLDTVLASVNFVGIAELRRELNYYAISIDNILEIDYPVGLQTHINQVCKLLCMGEKDKQAIAVIISGLGGMGKTTLASASVQTVASSMTSFKFSRIIFDNTIQSGRASHIKQLQQQLVNNLTGSKNEFGNTADARCRLKEVLEHTCSFIFIDNVNFTCDVEQLLPQELDLNPGINLRILITSRNRDVRFKVPRVCKREQYRMQALPMEDAETLLCNIVMDSINGQEQFPGELQMLKEVKKLCCGIPIVLYLIGTHLKDDRRLECYQQVIEELRKGDLTSYEHCYERLNDTRLFVYKNMKIDLQNAFLDICNVFLIGRLHLPGNAKNWRMLALTIGENVMETLTKKGVVNKNDRDTEIHDILLKMMSTEFNEYCLRGFPQNKKDMKGIERYVDAIDGSLNGEDLDLLHGSLRGLFVRNVRVSRKCQSIFKELRWIAVSSADLPFTSLHGFSKLTRLELFYCEDLIELPSSICSLSCLRILHVVYCSKLQTCPRDLSSLTSLLVLRIWACFSLNGLWDGRQLPHNLKFLGISSCPKIRLPTDLVHMTLLEQCELCSLKCEHESVFNFPCASNLKMLCLSSNKGLMALHGDCSKLQNLEELDLSYTGIQELPSELWHNARNIRKLQIDGCRQLRSLPSEIYLLAKLHTLDFSGCSNVRAVPQSLQNISSLSTLGISCITDIPPLLFCFLTNLQELKLQDCPALENLPENICMLSKLEVLKLKNCPELKNLPENIGILSNLRTLHITEAPVKRLPDGIRGLSNLTELQLIALPITDLPPMLRSSLPNLSRLIISDCKELKNIADDIGM